MTEGPVVYEVRTPPADPALVAMARSKPGGWVYEIDWSYPPAQRTPPEAIRGSWEVSADGRFTGQFARNMRYRAISRSDRVLKPYMRAAAKHHPDQWMVEIDPSGEALFPNIPEKLIRGWWYVDKAGALTDLFRPNSLWQP